MTAAASRSPGANTFKITLDLDTLLPGTLFAGVSTGFEMAHIPEVHVNASSVWHDDNILGRSEPFKSYAYSPNTQISFTGKLVVQGDMKSRNIPTEVLAGALGLTGRFVGSSAPFLGPAGNLASLAMRGQLFEKPSDVQERVVVAVFKEVTQVAAWFEALTKPQYDLMGYAYPPPHVRVQYGQNFTRRGVVGSVNLVYRGPWEVATLLCMEVEVGFTLLEDNKIPKGFLDAANMKTEAVKRNYVDPNLYGTGQAAIDNARALTGL
jgi:hypothetical protein